MTPLKATYSVCIYAWSRQAKSPPLLICCFLLAFWFFGTFFKNSQASQQSTSGNTDLQRDSGIERVYLMSYRFLHMSPWERKRFWAPHCGHWFGKIDTKSKTSQEKIQQNKQTLFRWHPTNFMQMSWRWRLILTIPSL